MDHMATLFLVLCGASLPCSMVVALFYIPSNNVGGFPFLHTSPAFVICRFFNDGHFDSFSLDFQSPPRTTKSDSLGEEPENLYFFFFFYSPPLTVVITKKSVCVGWGAEWGVLHSS